jgi:hypothetical protein
MEKHALVLSAAACPLCSDGAYSLTLHTRVSPGKRTTSIEASEVYDERGECRRCGTAATNIVDLERPAALAGATV